MITEEGVALFVCIMIVVGLAFLENNERMNKLELRIEQLESQRDQLSQLDSQPHPPGDE